MAIYTGTQDVLPHGRPKRPTLAGVLGLLDRAAEQHGIVYTTAAVKHARQAAKRASELRTTWSAHTRAGRDAAAAAGRAYSTGEGSAEDVVTAALTAAPLDVAEVREAARKLVEHAAAAVEAGGMAALETMTEAQWLAPITPVVAERVARAQAEADAVGITGPRITRVGVRKAGHPWTPDRDALRNTPVRHAWERLGEAIEDLHAVHALADTLRRRGLLPTAPGRQMLEDYRWLHLNHLDGDPTSFREFWLTNRHDGEPGIFTVEQMVAADAARGANEAGHHEDGTTEAASA